MFFMNIASKYAFNWKFPQRKRMKKLHLKLQKWLKSQNSKEIHNKSIYVCIYNIIKWKGSDQKFMTSFLPTTYYSKWTNKWASEKLCVWECHTELHINIHIVVVLFHPLLSRSHFFFIHSNIKKKKENCVYKKSLSHTIYIVDIHIGDDSDWETCCCGCDEKNIRKSFRTSSSNTNAQTRKLSLLLFSSSSRTQNYNFFRYRKNFLFQYFP